jgi:hypothetical protein
MATNSPNKATYSRKDINHLVPESFHPVKLEISSTLCINRFFEQLPTEWLRGSTYDEYCRNLPTKCADGSKILHFCGIEMLDITYKEDGINDIIGNLAFQTGDIIDNKIYLFSCVVVDDDGSGHHDDDNKQIKETKKDTVLHIFTERDWYFTTAKRFTVKGSGITIVLIIIII